MDWQRLVLDIQGAGLTQTEIAVRTESSQASISDLLRGKVRDPRWSLGERLRALHALQCRPLAPAPSLQQPSSERL
jgi:predicted transcriptional regulator